MAQTPIDPKGLKTIRDAIAAALEAVETEHGITLSLGKITYDPDAQTFHARLDGTREGDDVYSVAWKQGAELLGLDPTWLGTVFRSKGEPMTIKGLKPRSTKVIAANRAGKLYLYDHEAVGRIIKIQRAAAAAGGHQ